MLIRLQLSARNDSRPVQHSPSNILIIQRKAKRQQQRRHSWRIPEEAPRVPPSTLIYFPGAPNVIGRNVASILRLTETHESHEATVKISLRDAFFQGITREAPSPSGSTTSSHQLHFFSYKMQNSWEKHLHIQKEHFTKFFLRWQITLEQKKGGAEQEGAEDYGQRPQPPLSSLPLPVLSFLASAPDFAINAGADPQESFFSRQKKESISSAFVARDASIFLSWAGFLNHTLRRLRRLRLGSHLFFYSYFS